MSMLTDVKPLPYSRESEEALLGALLLDSRKMEDVCKIISTDDFYLHINQILFKKMIDLYEANKPIDCVIVASTLDDTVIDEAYIYEVANSVPSVQNIIAYAEIVKERSTLRKLIKLAEEIQERCALGENPALIIHDSEIECKKIAGVKLNLKPFVYKPD